MPEQQSDNESPSVAKVKEGVAAPVSPPAPASATPPRDEPVDVSKLSAEEQMARFEKELKENDWGHQPC